MSCYISLFKIRYLNDLQYRVAALAGAATQIAWGFFFILLYSAFHRGSAESFPMEFGALTSYIWLGQAFLAVFFFWYSDGDIISSIQTGAVALELTRPVSVYWMWFSKSAAARLSSASLRCAPVLIIASLLPGPYGLSLPASVPAFVLFLVSITLSLAVVTALMLVLYTSTFYTVSSMGVRMVAGSVVSFFAGQIIPLPFFPESIRKAVELMPFAAMQNAPLRIYSGDLAGSAAYLAIGLQLFWTVVLIASGSLWLSRSLKKVVILGG